MDADEVSYVDANEDNWSQNDMWMVISKFFENRGLVKQQLKSYNSFINNCVDSVLDDKGHITLQSDQLLANKIKMDFNSNDDDEDQGKTIHISFGTSTVLRPTTPEGKQLTPMISRLRSLSYSLILRSDIRVVVLDSNKNMKQLDVDGVEIAKVPVMIRSEYCHLSNHRDDRAINDNLNECDYDPGGYFLSLIHI